MLINAISGSPDDYSTTGKPLEKTVIQKKANKIFLNKNSKQFQRLLSAFVLRVNAEDALDPTAGFFSVPLMER